LHLRQETPEEGGRQANTKFVQLVNRGHVGKEALRMRELIPSRTLRAGVKNLKLGAVQQARGSQAKTQKGWATLGEDLQTRLLKCPCGRGALPRPQDAVHFIEECAYSQPMREEVFKSMGAVVDREGQPQDKQMWAGLTNQGRLDYSLNSAKLFTPGVGSKAKSAGALAWAMGQEQACRGRNGETQRHRVADLGGRSAKGSDVPGGRPRRGLG
jgi:hypothetical protein